MWKNISNCILAIVLLLLAACQNGNDPTPTNPPEISIPFSEMNSAFKIEDDPVLANSHKNGDHLALVLRNLSGNTIVFPYDYGLKILILQDQKWNAVANGFLYTGGEKILPLSETFPPGLMAIAYPYIPNLDTPVCIRIVMIGYLDGEEANKVGAYIDIPLLP